MKKKIRLLSTLLFFITTQMQLLKAIKEVTVKVGGMVCVACTSVVDNHLKKIDGIEHVSNIDFKTGLVTVILTDDNTFTKKELTRKLDDALKKSTYEFKGVADTK